jgi:Holliday junction resolvase RusA-like endonuclease
MLTFTVYAVPQPKGSTKAFIPKGWIRPIITSDNARNKGWEQLVAEGASRAIAKLPAASRGLLVDGVRLTVAFYLPRPKKFQRRGVYPAHVTKPDLDKLVRSVKDALKRIAWQDDSQVVDVVAMKRYAAIDDVPHADIWVEPADGIAPLERNHPLFSGGADIPV